MAKATGKGRGSSQGRRSGGSSARGGKTNPESRGGTSRASKSAGGRSKSSASGGRGGAAGGSSTRRSASGRGAAASRSGARSAGSGRGATRGKGRSTGASAQKTADHDVIRQWAEQRGAEPSCVIGTGGKGDTGLLRLDFPGYSGAGKLQHISWDDWFEKFDEQNLALLFQERTKDGQPSNFNKLVERE